MSLADPWYIQYTHTQYTHVCFCELWGHSIGVMVLYCTNHIFYRSTPNLNLPLTGNLLHFYFLKKVKLILYDLYRSFCTHGDLNLGPHRDTCPHESVCIQV